MKISVIIPTYKPPYLWECLDSLAAQTFSKKDFEVILVLNGCKNPWESKIRKYMSMHSELNINFIQTNQGGVSNARNIALDVAKGEYVTFIDDDDYVSPFYLEELYEKASLNTISLCYPFAFNDDNPTTQLSSYSVTENYDRTALNGRQPYTVAPKFFSGPCMKLIPMSYIQNRKYDVRLKNGEDSLYMFLLSDKFEFVDYTSKKAVYYRRYRENSAMTRKHSRWYIIRNSILMLCVYSKIIFRHPFSYNWFFYFSRISGIIHTIIVGR